MAAAKHHTFIVLTKRADRMAEFCCDWLPMEAQADGGVSMSRSVLHEAEHRIRPDRPLTAETPPWPLPNVILMTSVEDQPSADLRIPDLLRCPAVCRGVSVEPMLAALNLRQYMPRRCCSGVGCGCGGAVIDEPALAWCIAGAESGPNRRPLWNDAFRSLRDQCTAAGIPFFLKQMGNREDGTGRIVKMPHLDGKVWAERPEVTP
jgi:protein gp37